MVYRVPGAVPGAMCLWDLSPEPERQRRAECLNPTPEASASQRPCRVLVGFEPGARASAKGGMPESHSRGQREPAAVPGACGI